MISATIDLFREHDVRRAVQEEAFRASGLCSRTDEPFRHDRSKPKGYCEMDTYMILDNEHGTYMDVFGKYLSGDEVNLRRKLEAERIAQAKAKREADEAAERQRQLDMTARL